MGYENLIIVFKGMTPTKSLKQWVRILADKIQWESPSDANLKIVCEQSGQWLKASCRIASQVGVFVAEAAAETPEKCIEKLELQVQNKLNSWKKKRRFRLLENQLEPACQLLK